MTQDLLIFSSITYAYKAQKILEQNWMKSSVIRTPAAYSNRGCGYSLALNKDLEKAERVIRGSGIRILRVVRGAEV